MRHRATALLSLPLVLVACSRGDAPPMVGTIERDRIEMAAFEAEPLMQLAVREGQAVKKGQLLVQLDPQAAQARRDQAAAALAEAQHRLSELVSGPRAEEILEARARLSAAEADVVRETAEYERQAKLIERQLVSRSTFDAQRAARDRAAANRRQAQAALAVLLKGTRVEELDQARAAQAAAQSQLQSAALSLARLTVTAPQDASVEALPYRLGERPAVGAPVVILLASDRTFARVHVPEPLRASLVAGARVRVRVDGVAEAITGTLRYVSADAAFTPYYALTQRDRSRLAYVAEVDLPAAQAANLPAGVPVEAYIEDAAR